jgi:putative oxidoreductase
MVITMDRLDSMTALAGRLCLSAIFLISAVEKLMAPAAVVADIESVGLPFAWLGFSVAVAIELLGGLALVTGYALRWGAGILAAFTVVAGLIFHSNFADQNQFVHFLKNVAITGGLLQVIALGKITRENRR